MKAFKNVSSDILRKIRLAICIIAESLPCHVSKLYFTDLSFIIWKWCTNSGCPLEIGLRYQRSSFNSLWTTVYCMKHDVYSMIFYYRLLGTISEGYSRFKDSRNTGLYSSAWMNCILDLRNLVLEKYCKVRRTAFRNICSSRKRA